MYDFTVKWIVNKSWTLVPIRKLKFTVDKLSLSLYQRLKLCLAHLYEFGAPLIWYDTESIRSAVSNYMQFGGKEKKASVQFKNLLVNKKSRNVYPRWCPCDVREDEQDHVESMK